MAKRQSPMSVIQPNTLWFIVKAISASGGTTGSASINQDVRDYLSTKGSAIGARLSPDQLGIFSQGAFSDFFDRFSEELTKVIRSYNWLGTNDVITSLGSWEDSTALGRMSADLVDEFDGKVEWQPPKPVN